VQNGIYLSAPHHVESWRGCQRNSKASIPWNRSPIGPQQGKSSKAGQVTLFLEFFGSDLSMALRARYRRVEEFQEQLRKWKVHRPGSYFCTTEGPVQDSIYLSAHHHHVEKAGKFGSLDSMEQSLTGLQHGKSSRAVQVTITRTTLQPALRSGGAGKYNSFATPPTVQLTLGF
jgi:hypothetical protein